MVWDPIEIPCSLAVSSYIFPCKRESRKFDNDCYNKATQMRFYASIVILMDEPDMWNCTKLLHIECPNYEPKRGKLSRNRRK